MGAPIDIKTAIARLERGNRHATFSQQGHPGTIGTQLGPTAATEGQNHRIRFKQRFTARGGEAQAAMPAIAAIAGIPLPTQPAMPHMEMHALLAQAMQPGAQQRRSFHFGGKNPPRGTDEGLNPEAMNPVAQLIRPKYIKQAGQLAFPLAVTRLEGAQVFAMGNVHAALAGDQKLATDRRHGIENSHFQAVDRSNAIWDGRQHFGGHQPRRTAADNGDAAHQAAGTPAAA